MSGSARTGRRPGDSGTRAAILDAARGQFAERGYDRTSMRSIAKEAGVDPTLVSHFHGSKQKLFIAAMGLPFDPSDVLPALLAGDTDGAGSRLAGFIIGVLETEEGRARITGLVRAAVSEPEAARMLRDLLARDMFAPLAESLGSDDADLRASLVGSQVVGMVTARYIVAVEPLASCTPEAVVSLIAPTLQRYLVEPLQGGG